MNVNIDYRSIDAILHKYFFSQIFAKKETLFSFYRNEARNFIVIAGLSTSCDCIQALAIGF